MIFPFIRRKGNKTPTFKRKEVEKMSSQDIRISKQFCKFCTRVLKNAVNDIHRENAKLRQQEKSLNELTGDEIIRLSVCDKYFNDEHIFNVLDSEIVVMGNELAAAIKKLPQKKRDVILLSYFVGMSDKEIGNELGAIPQTICKRRTSSLRQLREYLKKEGY